MANFAQRASLSLHVQYDPASGEEPGERHQGRQEMMAAWEALTEQNISFHSTAAEAH